MSRLKGTKQARARARQRPDILDQKTVAAISDTVDEVHQAGRNNIDNMVKRRKGLLRRRYTKSVRKAKKVGLVGYITKSARRAAFYARFVHDGTKFAASRPFHDLAVAEQEGPHKRRMRSALQKTISGAASPSGLAKTGRGKVSGV
jgi:hypothetical protein